LELYGRSTVEFVVRHFEDGMIFEDMQLTKDPWTLIKKCASTGRTTAAFREIDCTTILMRSYRTKFEEFVYIGLARQILADWVIELHSFTSEIEDVYERDATLADPVRAQ
jgi:hypothetical protein